MSMSQEALEARRAYKREYAKKWRKKNSQKEKEAHERYWERKAAELKQQEELKQKAE